MSPVDRLGLGALAAGIGGVFLAVRPFASPYAAFGPICFAHAVPHGHLDTCGLCCGAAFAVVCAGLMLGSSGAVDLFRLAPAVGRRKR